MSFAAVNAPEVNERPVSETKLSPKPRYKSFKKKYNKERYKFKSIMEANQELHKDEQNLLKVARRLQEENE
jgi:hypothetical protein